MKGKQWQGADVAAAELVVLYRADINLIQKTMHYVRSVRPTYPDLRDWLEAQIRAAAYFPRSNQTLNHQVIAKALVEWIGDEFTKDPEQIAEMLGWITRLMRYYLYELDEARALADKQNPMLYVPKSPVIAPRTPPQPPSPPRIRPAATDNDEVSDATKRFMDFLNKRGKTE